MLLRYPPIRWLKRPVHLFFFFFANLASPSIDGQSNSEMDHDTNQSMNDGTLKNKSPLNTLDGCHQVEKQEYNDARDKSEPEYSDAIRTVSSNSKEKDQETEFSTKTR